MKSDKAAGAFGQRLRELMQAQGRGSETSRSGVDVGALADAASTSYEMARRYAEGLAMPRPDKLQRIAAWLGVPAASLAWGTAEQETQVNAEILQRCLEAVMAAQAATGVNLTTARASALVAAIYQEAIDGRFPAAATVSRMMRAMT